MDVHTDTFNHNANIILFVVHPPFGNHEECKRTNNQTNSPETKHAKVRKVEAG